MRGRVRATCSGSKCGTSVYRGARSVDQGVVPSRMWWPSRVSAYWQASSQQRRNKPDTTLTVHTVSIAVGAGYSWGGGIVTFQGHEYPCRIDGLAVGAVGISSADAIGNVYHLAVVWDCPRPSPYATRARAARPPQTWGATSGSCATTVAIRPSSSSLYRSLLWRAAISRSRRTRQSRVHTWYGEN